MSFRECNKLDHVAVGACVHDLCHLLDSFGAGMSIMLREILYPCGDLFDGLEKDCHCELAKLVDGNSVFLSSLSKD